MYEEFFGFKEKPFSLLPDPGFLYMSDKHRLALTNLEYGLANLAGFTVITGEIGSGKTTLIRKLLLRNDPNVTVGLVTNTQCSGAEELLRWIAFAFGLNYAGKSHVELYQVFMEFLVAEYGAGRRVVVVIDEAQQLGPQLLEQVRLLSNINAYKHQVVQFILVGQPNLRDHLSRPELHQFAQRIAVDYHLQALDPRETQAYIGHRLLLVGGDADLFAPEAVLLVWRHSRGIPRLINILCDTALVYAFSEQTRRIEAPIMKEVLRDKRTGLAPVQGAAPAAVRQRASDGPTPHSSIENLYGTK
jgi:type II secretory pathway predicted ATPase ExeA